MKKEATLINGSKVKTCSVGIDYLSLILPGLSMLMRRDWSGWLKWILIQLGMSYGIGFLLYGVIGIEMDLDIYYKFGMKLFIALNYNKWYIKKLIRKGYKPAGMDDEWVMKEHDINYAGTSIT